MTYSGSTLTATNAGTYTVTFSLKSKTNYVWSGGGTDDKKITLTISPMQITLPTISPTSLVYNGSEQNFTISYTYIDALNVSPPRDMTVSSDKTTLTAKEAENYTVTFTLTNTTNFVWWDGETGSKTVTVSIAKKPLDFTVVLNDDGLPSWDGDGKPVGAEIDKTEVESGDSADDIKIVYRYISKDGTDPYDDTVPPTKRGDYTLIVEIVDPEGNYTLSDDETKSYDYKYAGTAIVPFTDDDQLVWKYTNGGVDVKTVEYVQGADVYTQYSSVSPYTVVYNGNEYSFYDDETALATLGLKVNSYGGTTVSTNASSTVLSATVTFVELDTTWAEYTSTTSYTLYWKIDFAKFDLSTVKWNYDSAFEFDKTSHSVTLDGVPTGLTATYETMNLQETDPIYEDGNSETAVGEYKTLVVFVLDDSADSKYANYYIPEEDEDNYINTGSTFTFTLAWMIDKATINLKWKMVDYTDTNNYQFKIPKLEDGKGVVTYKYYVYSTDANEHMGDEVQLSSIVYDENNAQRYVVLAVLGNTDSYKFSEGKNSINPRAFTVGVSTEDVKLAVTVTAVYNGQGQAVEISIANIADTTCSVDELVVTYLDSSRAPLGDGKLPQMRVLIT
jgi:hypothetical protein